jgi:hypothetical protein
MRRRGSHATTGTAIDFRTNLTVSPPHRRTATDREARVDVPAAGISRGRRADAVRIRAGVARGALCGRLASATPTGKLDGEPRRLQRSIRLNDVRGPIRYFGDLETTGVPRDRKRDVYGGGPPGPGVHVDAAGPLASAAQTWRHPEEGPLAPEGPLADSRRADHLQRLAVLGADHRVRWRHAQVPARATPRDTGHETDRLNRDSTTAHPPPPGTTLRAPSRTSAPRGRSSRRPCRGRRGTSRWSCPLSGRPRGCRRCRR